MSDRTTSVFDRVSDHDVSARFAVSAALPPGSSDGRSPSLRNCDGESASFSSKVGLAISPSAWRQAARHAQWSRTKKRKTLAASQINESQDSAWALRGNRHCAPSPPRSYAVRLCSHVSPRLKRHSRSTCSGNHMWNRALHPARSAHHTCRGQWRAALTARAGRAVSGKF